MSRNPELTGTILKIVAALAALTIAISVGAFLVGVYSKGMLLLNSVTTAYLAIKNTELMLTFKVAAMYAKNLIMLGLTTAATAAWSAAQTVLNFVLSMNPIGLVIVAVAGLIAVMASTITELIAVMGSTTIGLIAVMESTII